MKKFKLIKDEDGVGVVWFTLSFIAVIFIAGLAIDGGRLYETKSELRKAADAAVLSGAQNLTLSDSYVTDLVNRILAAHNEQSSLKDLPQITHQADESRVTVTLKRNVPLYFMRLFGFSSAPVSIRSSAAIYPLVKTSGIVPFGLNEDVINTDPDLYQKTIELKVDSGDSTYGNFGIVALSGVGGRLYEDALKYGYDSDIDISDPNNPVIIDTQTGNVQQKTIKGVNYRISISPYAEFDPEHMDDPRIITILVYKPEKITTNQLKSIRVTGFAYFYLDQPMSSTDSTVKGHFLRTVGRGIGKKDALDCGAYGVKLVE
ncbi:MAG: pilus assembly protein TadG-related protein [Bacillota bacterium]|nr:pilus assembly protein TadG-related protein [Bacillota bacterium]